MPWPSGVSPSASATTADVDAGAIARPAIPVGRPGRAREVAALIAHLVHPDAAYITGVSIVVDGGLLLMSAIANQDHAGRI